MHFSGLSGMPRRISDYPDVYWLWNFVSSVGAFVSFIGLLIFVYMLILVFFNRLIIINVYNKYLLHKYNNQYLITRAYNKRFLVRATNLPEYKYQDIIDNDYLWVILAIKEQKHTVLDIIIFSILKAKHRNSYFGIFRK